MEASTVARQAPPEPDESHDGDAEATRTTEELFQWSMFVHVGDGADDCEHAIDGKCDVKGHFHCWLCLPNTFQARDIQDKARAAKARKRRSLQADGSGGKEPSDSYLVLEEQIEAWESNEVTFDALVRVIANRNVQAQLGEIAEELQDSDQFEHYGPDLEEWRRLEKLSEEDRDPEEWKRLEDDMKTYREEFDKRAKARFEREQTILKAESHENVLKLERTYQIDAATQEQFLHTYYTWAYYTGARVPTEDGYPTERIFSKPEDLRNAAPEVVASLRAAYRSLESRMLVRGDAAGN